MTRAAVHFPRSSHRASWNASIVMSDIDDTCYEPGSPEIPFDSDSTYTSTTPTGTCTGGDINDQTGPVLKENTSHQCWKYLRRYIEP